MVQWCQNALRLEARLPRHWRVEQLVMSRSPDLVNRLSSLSGCRALKPVAVPPALSNAARACVHKLRYHEDLFFQGVNLHKWQLFALSAYDLLLFADVDLELVPLAEHEPSWSAAAWQRFFERFMNRPHLRIAVDPDAYSPLNGGLMLIRPSAALYDEGLGVLRACRFNTSHGWE
jgi:hypothetical protein